MFSGLCYSIEGQRMLTKKDMAEKLVEKQSESICAESVEKRHSCEIFLVLSGNFFGLKKDIVSEDPNFAASQLYLQVSN